jgi:flagellar assembly protein FliH
MIIKKKAGGVNKAEPQVVENAAVPGEIDLFNLDNIDFKQRQERRRGDRRRGFRRIDDRNLISRAREEAQTIKESASKEGYEEGLAQSAADLAEVKNAIGAFFNAKQEVFDQIVPHLMDIGMDIARKIIKKEVESHPEFILDNIKEILKGLSREETKITIKANPAQTDMLKKEVPAVMENVGSDAKVYIVPDEAVFEGGCVVTTTNGVIDATIDTQLAVIREVLRSVNSEPFSKNKN